MKKFVLIATVFFFFLALIVLLLLKLFSGSSKPPVNKQSTSFPTANIAQNLLQESAPQDIARECFSWYVRYFASSTEWSYKIISANPAIQRCFSADFIQSWQEVIGVSETDPVLISPDYYFSWSNVVKTRLTSQLSGSSDVEVTLGTGTQEQVLNAELRRTSTGWQIFSVSLIRQAQGN